MRYIFLVLFLWRTLTKTLPIKFDFLLSARAKKSLPDMILIITISHIIWHLSHRHII